MNWAGVELLGLTVLGLLFALWIGFRLLGLLGIFMEHRLRQVDPKDREPRYHRDIDSEVARQDRFRAGRP